MYSSKLKTKYRIISFFMSIVFVFSNIAQVLPITAFGEEPQKLNFAWILNDGSDNQSINDNGKNSVWKVKADSYVEMKAALNVSLKADTERVNITLPKSAYTNSDETSVDLDTEALGDFYDAVLNEENGTYEITPKQVIADTELNMNVVYKGQVKENAEFDINADVMQNDESVTYSVHGMTEIISEDEDSSATVENANTKNLDADTKILDIPDVQTNINKMADNGNVQYTVRWNGIEDVDKDTENNPIWNFKTEQYYNFSAALHLGGLPNNTTRTFEITLPKYLYKYRDSNIGPILDVKGLKDSGLNVKDNNNGTYTVTKTGKDQTMDFIFTYKNASLVKTQSGTEIDMPITVKISDQEDTYSRKLEGTIKTSISSIRPSKEYAGKVSDNGQIKDWTPALQSVYGITKTEFDKPCDDPNKEYRFSEYCITADVIGCQPYTISINESPTDGEVIAVTDGSKMLTAAGTDGYYSFDKIYNKEDPNYNESPKIYALVRYTTDKNTTRKLHNTVNVKATGIDDTNKSVEKDAQITHQWAVANVDYDRGVWGIAKGYSRSNISGAIDILKNGGNKQFFYQAVGYANTSRYLVSDNEDNPQEIFNAYKTTNKEKPTYRIEVMDDAMFIGKKDGKFLQLQPGDYEFNTCRVYLSVNKMTGNWNENDGEPELNPPVNKEYPYTNIGEEDNISRIKVYANGTSVNVPSDIKTDKNGEKYVEVTLPEGTTTVKAVFTEKELGENRLRLDLYGQWKGSGTTFTKNKDAIFGTDNSTKSIPVINWDAIHGYQETGAEFYADFNGNSKFGRTNGSWQNPVSETCWYNSDTKEQMLEFDKKYDGHGEIYDNVIVPEGSGDDSTDVEGYSQRSVITHNIYTTPIYGGAAKWGSNRIEPTDGKDSDGKAAATMSYNLIAMYGGLTGYSSDLDQLINTKVMTSTKKAVFYDLLPKGMEYQSIEPLTGTQTVDTNVNGQFTWNFEDITGGEYKFIPDANGMKTVYSLQKYQGASVEVMDNNYDNSGRQLLKITVTYNKLPKAYFAGYKTNLWSLFFSAKINVKATDKSGKFNKTNYQNYVAAKFYDDEKGEPIEIKDDPVVNSMTDFCDKITEDPFVKFDEETADKQTVVHAQAISRGNQNADASNILKSIKADHYDKEWKDSTYTDLGGTYKYRLLYNLNKGTSHDVVIFDTIEFAGTQWSEHGELTDISVELPKGLQSKSGDLKIYYKAGNNPPTDTNNDEVFDQKDIEPFLNNGFTELSKSNDPKQNYTIPEANKKSITIAIKFNGITFNADEDNDYAAVYLKMKATNEWNDRTKKAYNDVSYYNVLDATSVGSLQPGNVVNIGLRGIEKPFSLTKNFVDGVGTNPTNDPKSYFGNVNFKLECTKVDYELDEYDKSKDLTIIEKETKTAEGTTQTDLVSDFDYTMSFNGETTKTAVDFAKARFTKAGTYTFKVSEFNTQSDNEHVDYDKTEYTVEVTVERDTDPSKFKITKTEIKKDGTLVTDEDIEFTNTVIKEPEKLIVNEPFKIRKTFAGTMPKNDRFYAYVVPTKSENISVTVAANALDKTNGKKYGTGYVFRSPLFSLGDTNKQQNIRTFSKFTFSKAGTYTYNINEVFSRNGSYTAVSNYTGNVYTYDQSRYKVTIEVVKENGALKVKSKTITKVRDRNNTTLSPPEEITYDTIDSDGIPVINFTNEPKSNYSLNRQESIKVNKYFYNNSNNNDSKSFSFKLESYDDFSENTIKIDETNYGSEKTVSVENLSGKDNSIQGESSFDLKFTKPGIYRYLLSEPMPDNINMDYWNQSVYLVTYTVGNATFGRNVYMLKDRYGNELERPGWVSFLYNNAYNYTIIKISNLDNYVLATPPTIRKKVDILYNDREFIQDINESDYKFKLKYISGKDLNGNEIEEKPYFEYDTEKSAEKLLTMTVSSEAKTSNFSNVVLSKAGTYQFEISEEDSDKSVIDNRIYTWTVNVVEKNDKLVVKSSNVTLKTDDTSIESNYDSKDNSITFENKFINKGTFEPRVKKILKGLNSAIDDEEIPTEYTFKITAVTENAPMPENRQVTVTVGEKNSDGTATGEASFGVINFNVSADVDTMKTYKYQIEEIKPVNDKSHVQYDTTEYELNITIRNGVIITKKYKKITDKTTTSLDKFYHDFEFTNTLHDEENGHKAEISFTKYIEGNDKELATNGRDFTFKLEPIDNAPEPNKDSALMELNHKKK